jgi:excisionase family DNA binding protein
MDYMDTKLGVADNLLGEVKAMADRLMLRQTDAADRLMLRPTEAADALGFSRSKTYELIAARAIPSVKVGGCVRVPLDALREWIARQIEQQA